MPDINMQVFEEAKRNQLVTEVDIQTQVALDDYQVQLSDIANPTRSQDNVVIDRFGEFLPHWNESLDFDTWVKMSMEVSGKRGLLIHGNNGLSGGSSGNDTFLEYSGLTSGSYVDSNLTSMPVIYESNVNVGGTNHNILLGVSNIAQAGNDFATFQFYEPTSTRYGFYKINGVQNNINETPTITEGIDTNIKIVVTGSRMDWYVDDNPIASGLASTITDSMGLKMQIDAGTCTQNWAFIRKYTVIEPTVTIGTPKNIATSLKSLGRAG